MRSLGLNTPAAEGVLSSADCRVREMLGGNDNDLAHPYQVTVRERGSLSLLLGSGQFDAYLIVYDPQRQRIVCKDDDSAGNRNALCTLTDLAAGSYLVLAKALGGNTGVYRLQATFNPPAQATPVFGCRSQDVALNGPEAFGTLSDASCRVRQILGRGEDNSPGDQYRISVPQRGTLQIDLRSDAFDPVLILFDTQYRQIAADDDSGGGRNARIRLTVDPGTYIVVAKSYDRRNGAYRLQASFGS